MKNIEKDLFHFAAKDVPLKAVFFNGAGYNQVNPVPCGKFGDPVKRRR